LTSSPATAGDSRYWRTEMAVQQNKKSPSKRGMHRAHDFLCAPALAVEPVTGEDVAEDVVEGSYLAVRRKEVREALQTLPPEQRTVLEMAYFDGHTQARIAEVLQIPIGTVKTRTFAAMRKLRQALDGEDAA